MAEVSRSTAVDLRNHQTPAPGRPTEGVGRMLTPLYRNVPLAAGDDPALHELLALADALRVGRARERELAREELKGRLST